MIKMCMDHWNELKTAIKAAGMWDMVASDGSEAVNKFVESVDKPTIENFDPLITAHNLILQQALRVCGGAILESDDGGTCPLCAAADEVHKMLPANWISGAIGDCIARGEMLKPTEEGKMPWIEIDQRLKEPGLYITTDVKKPGYMAVLLVKHDDEGKHITVLKEDRILDPDGFYESARFHGPFLPKE
jgi:hypothetical protein